ncbi:uncharacterized protein STEHIDRAFT_159229 [Stereum hirsutum FP-91666 SS1]|uniref:uncharacterized protein n=1 Tax=Stereum hirsutum (strain FP-91666) TaxID=721885 RepID=UPI000440F326|nr:uncharacterized protein STEHIDRAFT_154685 [Stereum hirsutum FP-91666 SS1]XP_007306661.1 uncharacterized protein STEHIDRAFT_159229 [Stereum hirsutum FP-91666 SS1]EIM84564.1 hypothetical protein STEHIDRAFT_159229 [Stereum hirsutum FP-91666 SS1]EIM88981.1 hypothetical protein STEHIDRAFT_154685 [Stereum hirsutum FP-91666 SS1]
MTPPSKPLAASSKRGATFVNYTPAEAQGTKSKKGHAHWLATEIPIEHLVQTETQRKQISSIHQHGQLEDHSFEASDSKDQMIAKALLARCGLDTASLDNLKARWKFCINVNVVMLRERLERRSDMFLYHSPSALDM